MNKFVFSDHSFTHLGATGWQDSMSGGQKSYFLTSHIDFCLVLDNLEITVNEICFWKEK